MVWLFDEDNRKEDIAGLDDREKKKGTPEESMGKFITGPFKRKKLI